MHDLPTACEWPSKTSNEVCHEPAAVAVWDSKYGDSSGVFCRAHGEAMLARHKAAEQREREMRRRELKEQYERDIAAIDKEP